MADEVIPGGNTEATTEVDPQTTIQAEPETKLNADELMKELKSVRKEAASHRVKSVELNSTLEELKKQLSDRDNEINNLKLTVKDNKIKGEFNSVGYELGVIDTTAAYKLADTSIIEYDNEGNVNKDSVKKVFDKLKSEYPFVFRTGSNTNIDAATTGEKPLNGITSFFRSLE